ncbi:hypothetical protein [Amycolatopsis sp. NPDC051716]|jgi:L-2,4-diaminobutyric acid acetyltransferase|uniref:hypothetical protein n=1 Tax=Amycolatopsis sp. NPDC051716 TaxID=3155804 RepID=UPI003413518B
MVNLAAMPGGTMQSLMFDYRSPHVVDCSVIRSIAKQSNSTHGNSVEYYSTFFRDFSRTSLVACDPNRLIGFVIGYRRPAAPDDYVIAQQALLPEFDTVEARATLLTTAIGLQVCAGARRAEIAVLDGDRTTPAALGRVTRERGGRVESAGRPSADGGPPDCSLYLLGPFTPATN